MEGDAESEVHGRQDDGPLELMEQEADQAGLEDERVEEHEEDDDDVEEDRDVLDAAGKCNKAQPWGGREGRAALGPKGHPDAVLPVTWSSEAPPREHALWAPNEMKLRLPLAAQLDAATDKAFC